MLSYEPQNSWVLQMVSEPVSSSTRDLHYPQTSPFIRQLPQPTAQSHFQPTAQSHFQPTGQTSFQEIYSPSISEPCDGYYSIPYHQDPSKTHQESPYSIQDSWQHKIDLLLLNLKSSKSITAALETAQPSHPTAQETINRKSTISPQEQTLYLNQSMQMSVPNLNQDFESPSWLIFELEYSIKALESIESRIIIILLASINRKIDDTISLLQDKLLTVSLSDLERKRIKDLSYRVWNICIELTNHYPEYHDSYLNEFGFFAVNLDEISRNSCILDSPDKSILASSYCDTNLGFILLNIHESVIESTQDFFGRDLPLPILSGNLATQDSVFYKEEERAGIFVVVDTEKKLTELDLVLNSFNNPVAIVFEDLNGQRSHTSRLGSKTSLKSSLDQDLISPSTNNKVSDIKMVLPNEDSKNKTVRDEPLESDTPTKLDEMVILESTSERRAPDSSLRAKIRKIITWAQPYMKGRNVVISLEYLLEVEFQKAVNFKQSLHDNRSFCWIICIDKYCNEKKIFIFDPGGYIFDVK